MNDIRKEWNCQETGCTKPQAKYYFPFVIYRVSYRKMLKQGVQYRILGFSRQTRAGYFPALNYYLIGYFLLPNGFTSYL